MTIERRLIAIVALPLTMAAISRTDDFSSAMSGAMERMHQAMAVRSGGDPDRDFASMMVPHHQGAIDMARAELRFGKDERLRRLAQGIIVEQQQEIIVMKGILAEPAARSQGSSVQSHGDRR